MYKTPNCKHRLLREIAILRRLSSGHVVRLRDVCIPVGSSPEDFAEIFLVFDRCDGDLRQLIKVKGKQTCIETRKALNGYSKQEDAPSFDE